MIIGFGHKARVGKDTAAEYLVRQHGFKAVSFAHALKLTAKAAFDLTDDQVFGNQKLVVDPYWGYTPAQILQFLGTDVFRTVVDPDHWVRVAMREVDAHPDTNWVVTDVRFENEAKAIKARGGYVIRIDRDDDFRGDIGRPHNHPSETSLDDYAEWDAILDNNGSSVQSLFEGVDSLLRLIDENTLLTPWEDAA